MNKAEKVGFEWLQSNRGYSVDEIEFRQRVSPDFVCADGSKYEVKTAPLRESYIQFVEGQLEKLSETTLLLVDPKKEKVVKALLFEKVRKVFQDGRREAKHVHIILDDVEYRELEKVKGDKTWRELLMELCLIEKS